MATIIGMADGTLCASSDSSPAKKAPRFNFRLDVTIGDHKDGYGNSKAQLLVWALSGYKDTLYGSLIKAVRDGDAESMVDAGAALSDIESCDELLTQLTLELHSVATENAEVIWAANDPRREPATTAKYEKYYSDKIAKLLAQ